LSINDSGGGFIDEATSQGFYRAIRYGGKARAYFQFHMLDEDLHFERFPEVYILFVYTDLNAGLFGLSRRLVGRKHQDE
jgi:hypothetical protein